MKKQDPIQYIKQQLERIANVNSMSADVLYYYCKHYNTFYINSNDCITLTHLRIKLSKLSSKSPNIAIKGDYISLVLYADIPSDYTQDLLPDIVLAPRMYVYCDTPSHAKIVPIDLPANYSVNSIHVNVDGSIMPLTTTVKEDCGKTGRTIYCTPNASGVYNNPRILPSKGSANYTIQAGCFNGSYKQFYARLLADSRYGFFGKLKYLRQVRQLIKAAKKGK